MGFGGFAGCARPLEQDEPTRTTDSRPNVLLVTLDTTRADELAPYGGSASTPNLSRVAAEGIVFTDVITPMPTTRPAHASLMSGLPPRLHGVGDNGTPLPDGPFPTLAQHFRDQGWATAAFTAASVLDEHSGFDRGFDSFASTNGRGQRPGPEVAAEASAWIREAAARDTPLFVWAHLFDPHMPYGNPSRRSATAGFSRGQLPALLDDGDLPPEILERARRLYRDDIELMDQALGTILAATRSSQARPWVVLLVADHGECFELGYYFEHVGCLYDGAIQIPLILRLEDGQPGGHSDPRPSSIIDVGATLLDAAGLDFELGQGSSLLKPTVPDWNTHRFSERWPRSLGERRAERQSELTSVAGEPVRVWGEVPGQAVRTRDWLLVRDPPAVDLFPRTNAAATTSDEARARARDELLAALERLAAVPVVRAPSVAMDEESLRNLEALGYL